LTDSRNGAEAVHPTVDAIPDELRRELATRAGIDIAALRPVRVIAASHSELAEWALPSAEGPATLLIKRVVRTRDPEKARARLIREHDALRALAQRLGPELAGTIPTIIAAAPGELALAMSRLPGTPLSRILRRDANRLTGWIRGARARTAMVQVGTWLARFQAATRTEPVPHDHEAFVAAVAHQLDRITAVHPRDSLQPLLHAATEASRALVGSPLPAAGRHGDFLPQNVLVDGRRIGVVDFENYESRGVAFDDPGAFLGYLAMLEARRAYSPRALRKAREGFLQGYGVDPDLPAFRLYAFLGALTVTADSPRRGDPGMRRRLVELGREWIPRP